MFTLNGASVSHGTSVAKACVLHGTDLWHDSYSLNDPQSEIDRFLKKNSEFCGRLKQIGSSSPDLIRERFLSAAGFISAKENLDDISDLIQHGMTPTMACRSILIPKLNKIKFKANDPNKEFLETYNLCLEFISSLNLISTSAQVEIPNLSSEVIIIAEDLTPALFLSLPTNLVKGLVLEGGRTSGHLVTVLRELNIPAMFNVVGASAIKNGTTVVVDANNAVVIVDPPAESIDTLKAETRPYSDDFLNEAFSSKVTLSCSVGTIKGPEIQNLYSHYGIGLLRSEFLVLSDEKEPTEDHLVELFRAYFSSVAENAPLAARTFDFAADKNPMFTVNTDDEGPLKGYGAGVGTRLLKKELRAMLRAVPERKITIVFPLVTRVSESKYLHKLCQESQDELVLEQIPCSQYDTALMIETPAAVLSAKAFADQCSMFIIGTSSLAEYAAAPRPATQTFTPALAKMLMMAARAAYKAGVPIGVAGRYASRVELMPFFFKLGVTYITVESYRIDKLRQALEHLHLEDVQPGFDEELYKQVMNLFTGREISSLIDDLNLNI
ncbi:MAG: hypothetical protein K6F05_03695 [Succinivibrio sp.]|nr:hypothetical protein [Succinivibrio sp.]